MGKRYIKTEVKKYVGKDGVIFHNRYTCLNCGHEGNTGKLAFKNHECVPQPERVKA